MMYPGQAILHIDCFTVRADRIICDLTLMPGISHKVTPELVAQACAAFPDIPQHTCVNDEGNTFSAVMDQTSLPHLLEHLVISIQARSVVQTQMNTIFVGTTEWIDEDAGKARVEVSFIDDLLALRAFRDAIQFLSGLLIR